MKMSDDLLLLPTPQRLVVEDDVYALPAAGLIALQSGEPQRLWSIGRRAQQVLNAVTAGGSDRAAVADESQVGTASWELVAGSAAPPDQVGLTIAIVPAATRHPQGYELTITPTGMSITASTPAGAFYATCTLIQLLHSPISNIHSPMSNIQYPISPPSSPLHLPCLRISDWPDFPSRGVMLDVSRDKVPTLATLFDLVDLLASWKINQLQLYTEHTFAYRQHPEVWAEASPMTGEEIMALDAYCRERFVELVPNQNCFGHMRRWLTHDHYRHLAECPHGCDTVWGHFDEPFSLCPGDPGSLDLVRSLMDELLPHFSSRQFNVGCDETVDLGRGRSKAEVEERGAGRVYLDFLLQIYREVKARGRTMQFWGDIVMEHPELAAELPRDVIALEWGYEASHPFDEHGAIFAASGVPFYVCPGTSSWNSLAGRTANALANLRNAAENGLKHGAVGYLNTDWGDYGHWQPLPVSFLGFAYGAALSWACRANQDLDIAAAASAYAFQDAAGIIGQLAYDLGNVYQETGMATPNSTSLFRILQREPEWAAGQAELTADGLERTLATIDEVMAALPQARMGRPDAALIQREFVWAADMLRHACRRGIWVLDKAEDQALRQRLAGEAERLLAEHEAIWHARNRPGGFKDSQARLEKMRQPYVTE